MFTCHFVFLFLVEAHLLADLAGAVQSCENEIFHLDRLGDSPFNNAMEKHPNGSPRIAEKYPEVRRPRVKTYEYS